MHDPDEDVDRLVEALGLSAPVTPRSSSRGDESLEEWLGRLVAAQGSDLLLVAGAPASVRVDGRVARLDEDPLDGDEVEDGRPPSLPPHARRAYREHGIADASLPPAGLGRFRINLHRERGRAAAAIRALPDQAAPAGRASTCRRRSSS